MKLTPYVKHYQNWINCKRCPLCKVRKKVCIGRGQIPAEVLVIGEAPGISEDVIGEPFVGPAGRLLDRQIQEAIKEAGIKPPSIFFTNLVGCIPKEENSSRKKEEPLPEEIASCHERLVEVFALCKPKLIVAVGTLSEKRAKTKDWSSIAKLISIRHPAAILRDDIGIQGLNYQKVVVQLSNAFYDLRS